MIRAAALVVLVLAGCSKEANTLEQQYEIVAKGRDNHAKCDAAKKVADAHLRAGDETRYTETKLRADVNCSMAEMEPYNVEGVDVSSDNLTAMPDNTGL